MPYVAPKPRQLVPQQINDVRSPSSDLMPSFTKSKSETPVASEIYSPEHEVISTTAPPLATEHDQGANTASPSVDNHTFTRSPSNLSRVSSNSAGPSTMSKRSSWSKRKPVPANISIPPSITSIPPTHPFARAVSSTSDGIPPISPRLRGPVPPRRAGAHNRSISNLATPASPSTESHDSASFWTSNTPKTVDQEGMEDRVEVLQRAANESGSEEVMEDKRSRQQKPIPSRGSSRNSSHIPQLGPPLTTRTERSSSSANHGSGAPTPYASHSHHPLRLRVDKSLPALPLDHDTEPSSTNRRTSHRISGSTSSRPSTHIVTPRTVSEPYAPQSPRLDGESQSEQKRRVKWSKGLTARFSRKDGDRENSSKSIGDSERAAVSSSKSKSSSSAKKAVQRPTSALAHTDTDSDSEFSVDGIPSKRRLWEAGTLFLTDENGDLVCFGDMFPKVPPPIQPGEPVPPSPRTVVFFIRHFWCGQCQDFMFASLSQLDPIAVEKAGIKVIVISNGSWKIIKSYKKLFKCPFPIYVDGPRKLYQLMGMTKMTNDFGPMFKGRAAYHQRSVPRQLISGGKNALTKMPMAYPGKLTQLGGEFILSPGYNCEFAHRMTNTSNHMEAPDVLREAGCLYPTKTEFEEITIAEHQRAEFERLEHEMQEWRIEREAELERIRRRKSERRGGQYVPKADGSMTASDGEEEQAQKGEEGMGLAQAAVSLPSDAPVGLEAEASTLPSGDGPVCLPVSSAPDVLAWEVEDEEVETPRQDLDRMFHEVIGMKSEKQIEMGELEGKFAGATFGRKASGSESGLEVNIVN